MSVRSKIEFSKKIVIYATTEEDARIPRGLGYGFVILDALDAESHFLTKTLAEKVGNHVEQYLEAMEKATKQGLKTAMTISSEGNDYLQESQFWKLYKEDLKSCSIVMRTSVGIVLRIEKFVCFAT